MKDIKKFKIEKLASDVNSPFIRNYIWVKGMPMLYPKLFKISSPFVFMGATKSDIGYLGDLNTWKKSHEEAKALLNGNINFYKDIIKKIITTGEDFNLWSETKLFKANLSSCSNSEIINLFELFIEKQAHLYALGTFLPLLDFIDFAFVENNLNTVLKASTKNEKEFQNAFRIFTQPINDSFIRLQEKDLLKIVLKYFSSEEWRRDVLNMSSEQFFEKYKDLDKKILKHLEKYAWVFYVYQGPALNKRDIFVMIQEIVKNNKAPSELISEFASDKKENEAAKKLFIQSKKLTQFEKAILNLAGLVVWAKPTRKDYQSKSYWHFEKLLKEISRRTSLSLNQVRTLDPVLLKSVLKKIDAKSIKEINQRLVSHVCIPQNNGSVKIYSGVESARMMKKWLKKADDENIDSVSILNGQVAFPGKVQGVVKIINKPEEMIKMLDGEVLVSMATTPSLVPVMKKASAIITDEGGLTCHASIVSREMKTPCVVGLKIATKVLKDGDLVEVDANSGVVKILKRAK